MKLFYHPVSTTCRPILLLAQHDGIELEYQLVDLLSGEHLSESYAAMNPSRQVPLLEDDDFRLTESSAILKYLAEKFHSPSYPADLRQRARINERMDWFNTGFYRDLGYCLVYPQVIPGYRRENPAVQGSLLAWGRERSIKWLTILDQHLIGSNKYVCGNELTIADYLGASILTLGDVIRLEYSKYPNVVRWVGTMKTLPAWEKANEGFYTHFVAGFKDAQFQGL